jgi:NADH-quinone oxidoreductase subunit L
LIAVRQDDIKKILAYSTVSQLGYMFLGVGVGAFREGVFHLTTHAFFKGLLFLAAGSVMHAMANRTDAWQMGGLRKVMPITFWTSVIGWLAISGVFPFAGFFSKDQLLTEAYMHGYLPLYVIGLITAVITAFYMSRWFFLIFWGEPRYGDDVHPHESPASMTIPLVVLAALSLAGGAVLNFQHTGPFYTFLEPSVAAIGDLGYEAAGPLTEFHLIAISLVAAGLGIGLAYLAYVRRDVSQGRMVEPVRGTVAEVFERKFFFDDLYETVFVRFGGWFGARLESFDRRVIDGAVDGAGGLSVGLGQVARRVQNGLLRTYVAGLLVGALALVVAVLIQVR